MAESPGRKYPTAGKNEHSHNRVNANFSSNTARGRTISPG